MPFSKETPPAQRYLSGLVTARWSQINTLRNQWIEKALRFLVLTNAGGAVAVLSFIGNSDEARQRCGPRIALGCFAAGIIIAGIFIAVYNSIGSTRWTKATIPIRLSIFRTRLNGIN
jgi:hypothetical protein